LGGGVIHGGQALGETNRGGTAIDGDALRIADLSATVLHLLGVDPKQEFQTSFGSPTMATDDGKVIQTVVG
jgi:hypothetical protein